MILETSIDIGYYPILLVEDDEVDTECFVRALKKSKIPNSFFSACDGVEALELLQGQNGKEKIQPPRIIFLDINMPRMNGFELLERIRAAEDPRQNIVFMLTTSARPEDIETANQYNVSGYLIKGDVTKLVDFLENLFKSNTKN